MTKEIKSKSARVKDPKRVAAGKRSRNKGSTAERAVVKTLAAWWGSGEWKRTPLSGGWAQSKEARDRFNAAGDVITTAHDWPFLVEIKAQEGWGLEQPLKNPTTCLIAKWWAQTIGETPAGKHPLLLFTRNNQPWYVIIGSDELGGSRLMVDAVRQYGPVLPIQIGESYVWLTTLDRLVQVNRARVVDLVAPFVRTPMLNE